MMTLFGQEIGKKLPYNTRLWVYFIFSLLTFSTGHTDPNILPRHVS